MFRSIPVVVLILSAVGIAGCQDPVSPPRSACDQRLVGVWVNEQWAEEDQGTNPAGARTSQGTIGVLILRADGTWNMQIAVPDMGPIYNPISIKRGPIWRDSDDEQGERLLIFENWRVWQIDELTPDKVVLSDPEWKTFTGRRYPEFHFPGLDEIIAQLESDQNPLTFESE